MDSRQNDTIDWSFETVRVSGRPIDEHDRALYRALYTDPTVMTHIAAAMDARDADTAFGKVIAYNAETKLRARYWQVSHRRSAAPIGMLSLVRDAKFPDRGELGVMLLPAWQHRGVGLQALAAVVDAVLSGRWPFAIEVLIGRHSIDNPGAARLMRALGADRLEPEALAEGSDGWRLTAKNFKTDRDSRRRFGLPPPSAVDS